MLPKLPAHFAVIALDAAEQSLAVAVVVDEKRAAPVTLRELIDGRILLGCLLDAGGRVHRYLEIWVQQASSLANASHLSAEAINNSKLDEKWLALAQAWAASGGDDVIVTGWERGFGRILQLDLAKKTATDLLGPNQKPLKLAHDEAALRAANLPSYATTLSRFLTDGEQFFPAASLADDAKKPILNAEGGPILVRTLHPLALAPYCDFLGGAPAELSLGDAKAQPWLDSTASIDSLDSDWVLGSHGRSGRMIEVLYLKLALLLDAFKSVRESIELTRLPLLNLSGDSFRVKFGEPGSSLPRRWGARAVLSAASEAIPLSIPGARRGSFLATKPHGEASYRAPAMRTGTTGGGTLRIRRINTGKTGHFILEGTLIAPSLAQPAATDIVWLRATIDGQARDLWGRAEVAGTTGPGELRFRSFEHPATPADLESLSKSDGLSVPDVLYSVTPALSSPCDLHSLAALAARLLLVNSDHPLGIAIDELMSVAKGSLSDDPEKSPALIQRISTLLHGDEQTAQQLGPQNVMYDPKAYALSAGAIPMHLWVRVLAFIVRCFPGAAPDSFAGDSGDAPADAIHRVFDPAIEELSTLLARARSLIFVDWFSAREISDVVLQRAGEAKRLLESAAPTKRSASSAASASGGAPASAPAPPPPPVRPANPISSTTR